VDAAAGSATTPVVAVGRLDDLAGRRAFDPAVSGLAG
jgi:hypothetical protein